MPRVIAGSAKGRRLIVPADGTVRPTSDRIKESLFGVLTPVLDGAMVLDVCAGSGSLGIEALSRGARFCTFIEPDRGCRDAIQQNLATAELASYARLLPMQAVEGLRAVKREGSGLIDLILADPPYDQPGLAKHILGEVGKGGLLRADGVLAIEVARTTADAAEYPGLEPWQVKHYGRTDVVLYRALPGPAEAEGAA